jgi:hypothetical protein
MKSLSLLLGLFFWGMVLKCLSEAMDVSVPITQAAVKWSGYGLWIAALMLFVFRIFRSALKENKGTHPEESQS